MTTKTLIKKIQNSQLAIVPRKQYEEFLKWQKRFFFRPAKGEPKVIKRSEKEFKTGEFKNWKDIKATWADFKEAKKAVFDFDIDKYVTKADFKKWKP